MSDLRIYDDFPKNHSTGHNIPQGLNFREKQGLETPVQLHVATLSVNNKLIQ